MEKMNYERTGILSIEEVQRPSKKRAAKAPFALLECPQEIPCDPCVNACKFGAITKSSLVAPPKINYNKCTGCGACISKCPGLAIFVIDLSKEKEAVVKIPYEFELPGINELIYALDKTGKIISDAKIIAVHKEKDKTCVVSIAVPKKHALNTRNIRRKK